MKFLRNVDKLSHTLASTQARIFENSVSSGVPSKIFIKSYMLSNEAKMIDDLNLNASGLSLNEISESIINKISIKKGTLYSYAIMHYIGYFYRMAAYLSGYSSKSLYQNIKPDLIYRNYETLHSLSIEEAIKEMFIIVNLKIEDKYDIFKKIYNNLD